MNVDTVTASANDRFWIDRDAPYPTLLWRRDDGAWIPLHSRRDPVAEAESWVAQARLDESRTVLLIGAGLGWAVDVLERRTAAATIVVIEPEPACARALLERRDWSAATAAGRFRLLVGPDYHGVSEAWRLLDPGGAAPAVIVHPVMARELPESMAQASAVARRIIFDARANADSRRQNAGRYLLNTLTNRRTIAAESDVARLFDRVTGMAAVIVAAGPSLDRNLDALRQVPDDAIVIAVDTALRPLLAAGIAPHLVVAVDPTEANARHLDDLEAPSTWLVAEGSLHPSALAPFAGRIFTCRVADHHPWPWFRSIGLERGQLAAWGSVLTSAFDLARRMGCDPIVFAGADLAFTDRRPYCWGTTADVDWAAIAFEGGTVEAAWQQAVGRWPLVSAPDLSGIPTTTAPHLIAFRDWLVEQAGVEPRRRVINASGSGILYGGGVQLMPLSEAMPRRSGCRGDVRDVLRAAHASGHPHRPPAAGDPDRETLASWQAFAGHSISLDAIARALNVCDGAERAGRSLDVRGLWRDLRGQAIANLRAQVSRPGEAIAAARLGDRDRVRLEQLQRERHDAAVLEIREDGEQIEPALNDRLDRLPPGGMLALADLSPRVVGARVRRTVSRILTQRHDASVVSDRHTDWCSRLTIITKAPHPSSPAAIGTPAAAAALAGLVTSRFVPSRVAVLAQNADMWVSAFRARLIEAADGFVLSREELGRLASQRFDVCVCLNAFEYLEAELEDLAIDAIVRASDVAVFWLPLAGLDRGGYPAARPVAYWSRKFVRRGFVVTDDLREAVEDRTDRTAQPFDMSLYTARRLPPDARESLASSPALQDALVAAAERIDDLSVQAALLRLHARDYSPIAPGGIPASSIELSFDRARIQHVGGHCYSFTPASVAVRRFARAESANAWCVAEDGQPLGRPDSLLAELHAEGRGRHAVWQGTIYFSSTDNSDPRTNGRRYAWMVPAHVRLLEELAEHPGFEAL